MPTKSGRSVQSLGKIAATIGRVVWFCVVAVGMTPAISLAEETACYQGPCALAASQDGKVLYAACADSRQVAWIELPAGKVTRRVKVPAEPTGLALSPDGARLIVTCAAPRSTVVIFNAATGNQIAAIPVGHTATGPAVSPDGKRLYVCNRFQDNVSVIDLAAGLGAGKELTRVPAVREPIAAAVSPDGRIVLVANHLPRTRVDGEFQGDVSPVVTVIDAQTLQTSGIELSHGANGLLGVCISPDGRHALVSHLLSNFQQVPFRVDMGWIDVNVVSLIDLRKRKLVRTIGMDEQDLGAANPWGVTFTRDGKMACVSLSGAHELAVIETSLLLDDSARAMSPMMGVWPIYTSLGSSMWRRIKLPGKGPRGLAAAGGKVYVAQYFSDAVAVVDPQSASETAQATIALGPTPKLTEQRRGQLLFHDATICYQQWLSCSSCHPDARMDGINWDLTNDGVGNPKNTKSMLWAHRTPPAMSEGVRESAEEAVRSGIRHILFAHRPEEEAVAIDTYLQSLRPIPSPHLINGRLSPAAERGRKLFESREIGCARCHPAPFYTDLNSHNVDSRSPNERTDRFDTPSLVEVWRTAPYLHDGRYTTVKQLFTEGKHGLRRGRAATLNDQEIDDLVEFVLSL